MDLIKNAGFNRLFLKRGTFYPFCINADCTKSTQNQIK